MKITLYEGNIRYLPVRLRLRGQSSNWDVSAATSIVLNWWNDSDDAQADIECDSEADGADWKEGLVIVPLTDTGVTEFAGTYFGVLTVTLAGSVMSVPVDEPLRLEVLRRPLV